MSEIFFDGWEVLLRTCAVGIAAYASLILLLRLSGKRTLSKINAFDLIVTVALGSTLATILLNKDVALAQGVVALALLIVLQFLITWTSVRQPWIRHAVTGEPSLMVYEGRLLPDAMHRQRVATEEVLAALRGDGLATPSEASAVILETDGSLSVIKKRDGSQTLQLPGVGESKDNAASPHEVM